MSYPSWDQIQHHIGNKMEAAGLAQPVIRSFLQAVQQVHHGHTGLIMENQIEPVLTLPSLESLDRNDYASSAPLESLAVIKLNGGLGTGMGLDKAKSLLPVKGEDCFLDFLARQILHLRQASRSENPRFLLMNSFSTQADSLHHLEKFPELARTGPLDFIQNKVPKLSAGTLLPVRHADQPDLEWCPPGHGDLYPSLLSSGLLDQLLNQGIRYLFVSNSDNLGATVDLTLLGYFAQSGLSFLMEVAQRTEVDKKGGHLARRSDNQRLILRESAQCHPDESASFQDIRRYSFFNTNSIWIYLPHLKSELEKCGGFLPLPIIKNLKTVDPAQRQSEPVIQIESAMGAAIECFQNSGALLVPRSRFAPVKSTNDLFALRSDAYQVTEDARIELIPERNGIPPLISLDASFYKNIDDFNQLVGMSLPSLKRCSSLSVDGPIKFPESGQIVGDVQFRNNHPSHQPLPLAPNHYENASFTLS